MPVSPWGDLLPAGRDIERSRASNVWGNKEAVRRLYAP